MTEGVVLDKRERDKVARMVRALATVDETLFRLGLQGLQRATAASIVELTAVSKTAHNGGLIHIERQLEVLISHVERYLRKDPLFSMSGYANTLNRIWLHGGAARRAIESGGTPASMLPVLGEGRRSYVVSDTPLAIQPIGAQGWASDTGYIGITIYFVTPGGGDTLYEASNAKPSDWFGTDPRTLLRQKVSDYLSQTISDFAHGAFVLDNAKLSHDRRISLHKALVVHAAPYAGARAYEPFLARSWSELVDRLRAHDAQPLAGSGAIHAYIEPAGYGPLTFDEKRGRATAVLVDEEGATMDIQLPLRRENRFVIENLTAITGSDDGGTTAVGTVTPDGLFGRVHVAEGRLKFMPYSAIFDESIAVEGRRERVHEWHLALEKRRV